MKRDIGWTMAALAATVLALLLTLADMGTHVRQADTATTIAVLAAALLLCGLTYGSIVYLLARLGYARRKPVDRSHADEAVSAAGKVPHVCVLVPSYKEEVRVLRQTVVSAALAEHPSRRIVVLIDDQPFGTGADAQSLAATHREIRRLNDVFRQTARHLQAEQAAFRQRCADARPIDGHAESRRLAALYRGIADWVIAHEERSRDAAFMHVDRLFNEEIVGAAARLYRDRANALERGGLDAGRIENEFARLASLFDVDISTFERKRFVNLSHAPSKAMNLNSYLGLLGRTFRITRTRDGDWLQECRAEEAEVVVPNADFLFTIDADSLVRHDYLRKLVATMLADERVAVAQTPYSAYPGAPTPIERTAGAQTDLMYVVHQGFSFFDAAYWVGANALLRANALQDIRQTIVERGHEVPVFIQDKTVIEDTGSSLDLVRKGWRLHNHPERLAYSATPPDFGALIIQRRRWANGGLIILGDLLRYVARPLGERPGLMELFMRTHYLCSPAISSLGVLMLAMLPLDGRLASPWLPLTALPYFLVYGWDLKRCGYGGLDLLRVYALNLMLLPINLAGVLRSVFQIVSGRKSAFGRTPKIGDRTSAPARHVALQILMLIGTAAAGLHAASTAQPFLAGFCGFNAMCLVYGFVRFVGIREACEDLAAAFPRRSEAKSDASPVRGAWSNDRITSFEGLRGYAVALVFAVHFIDHYFSRGQRLDFNTFDVATSANPVHALAFWAWSSHYGVDLFFLLSGFLIFRLVARADFAFGTFLRSRLQRLYPAFGVALLLYVAYQGVFWHRVPDWHTLLQNAVFLQGLFELNVPAIIVPSWSLSFEWLFYLTTPLLMLVLRRARPGPLKHWHVLVCGAATLAMLVPVGNHYARFAMFFAGGLLAAMPADVVKRSVDGVPEAMVIAAYLSVTTWFMFDKDYAHFSGPYAIACLLLVAKATYSDGVLARLFRWAPLRALGNVSYSFYLLHAIVLVAVVDHVGPLLQPLPAVLRFTLLIALAFVASVAAGMASFRWLEQPYFDRRHRDPQTAAPPVAEPVAEPVAVSGLRMRAPGS